MKSAADRKAIIILMFSKDSLKDLSQKATLSFQNKNNKILAFHFFSIKSVF